MNNSLFKEYAKLEIQYAELQKTKESLREKIVSELKKEGVEKAETDFGIFTRAKKISYEYTDAIRKLEEKTKLAKVKEQNSGKAKAVESEYLRYTPQKEK